MTKKFGNYEFNKIKEENSKHFALVEGKDILTIEDSGPDYNYVILNVTNEWVLGEDQAAGIVAFLVEKFGVEA